MKNKKAINSKILLIVAVVIVINILSDKFFIRFDFTADKRYTLSQTTKDILSNLSEPITVTAYFTKDLPPEFAKTKRDFKELLIEYANASGNNVVYEFVDPGKDPQTEQKTVQSGIRPAIISARSKDEVKQQKVYLGALVQLGEKSEAIPFIQRGSAMEYALSSSIKKLSVVDKPLIGFLQGNGEPSLNAYQQVMISLSILYNIEPVNLADSAPDLNKYTTIVIVAPTDSIPSEQLQLLDNYLANGGNLFIAYNRVIGDFSTASGKSLSTGLEKWLSEKGLTIENDFIVDAKCGSIGVKQQQGGFNFTTNIGFPYMPIISNFSDHPITKGLETVIMPFASPITFNGDTSLTFIPIAKTSNKTSTQTPPLYFDINKKWTENDFPLSNLTVAAVLSGKLVGNTESTIVVISDGDFPVNGEGQRTQQLQADNVSLMVNSIDWLSDATGLIELRTKEVTSRPLDQIKDGTKVFLKWFNFLLPILLIIIYGIIRMQYNKNKKIKRMEEGYV